LSRHFTKRGQFHAYTGTIHGTGSVGRAQIARFAAARAAAGDGWTATVLHAPVGKPAPPTRAVYGLGLRIYRNGLAARSGGAKLVVDCRSGLLLKWIGPGTTAPRD
jgi:hypothetical protein